jgi:chitin disaccharide deacetylase
VKSLIVNADDFGFTRDVNQGIVDAHRNGILTATTLMATEDAFDDAVRLSKETPSLDIGCHLVLVGSSPFPSTVAQLIRAVALRRIRPYEEMASQVRRVLDAGITPSHLDTHKHTHLLPPVLDAVTRISEEFKIPWVRKPFDFRTQPGGIGWKSQFMRLRRWGFERAFERHGCRSTDWFTGFRITGAYHAATLVELIRALPDGSTELMCHPGIFGAELQQARTRLKQSRQNELTALTSREVRAAVLEAGIQLVRYENLL